jgi:hypothetical protein
MDLLPAMPETFSDDPAEETILSLPSWPDSALSRLAEQLAGEMLGRCLPMRAALPVAQATYAAIGAGRAVV